MRQNVIKRNPKLILGRRMTLVVAGISVFLATGYLVSGLILIKSNLEREFEEDAEVIAASLAVPLVEAILTNNIYIIPELLDNARTTTPSLAYAFVVDSEGNPVAYTRNLGQGVPKDLVELIRDSARQRQQRRKWILKTEHGEIYQLAIRLEGNPGGTLILGFSLKRLDQKLADIAREFIGIILLGLCLSALIGALVYRSMTRPVEKLIGAVVSLGSGDLKARVQVSAKTNDEVALLSIAFNNMADQLQEKINELIKSRAELADEKTRIQAILDGMLHGVVFYEPDGSIRYMNKSAGEHWGWTEQHLPEYQEQLHGEALRAVEALNRVLSGETESAEIQVRKGERTFHILISAIRREDSALLGIVELSTDITDQLNSSRALAHAEKLNVIGQLAAGVAHEVNSPLDAALEAARILEKGEFKSEQVKEFARAQRMALERIASIIVRLLTFSRKAHTAKKSLPVWSIIHESAELIKYRLAKKNLSLELPEPELVPFFIEGEALELSQVFVNLLSNAIDASPEKGIIRVEAKKSGDWVEISVIDQGKGIPKSVLGSIFMPFFTTKEVGKGTGLGLAVSKNIVEQYGGRIVYQNLEPPWGAKFSVYLLIASTPLDQKQGVEASHNIQLSAKEG